MHFPVKMWNSSEPFKLSFSIEAVLNLDSTFPFQELTFALNHVIHGRFPQKPFNSFEKSESALLSDLI